MGRVGNKPDDKASKARQATGPGPPAIQHPPRIEVANDGTVYVTDRTTIAFNPSRWRENS